MARFSLIPAIYTSIIGHVIFFTGARLIITPISFPEVNYPLVNFLGRLLLEKQSVVLPLEENMPVLPPPHCVKVKFNLLPDFNTSQRLYSWGQRYQEKKQFSVQDEVIGGKILFVDKLKVKPQRVDVPSQALVIDGPAAERMIIFSPPLPAVPAELLTGQPLYSMELKFMILGDGRTSNIEPIKTSGSAEVDLLGINFVKSLSFTPLPEENNVLNWGKIILNFKIR